MTTTLNGQAVIAAAARDVADSLAATGVKYAAISFVDMHGKPKCKMVPLGHLVQAAMDPRCLPAPHSTACPRT